MTQKSFYLDSCIWLNLFKKEGDATKGVPYWQIAKNFIEKVERENDNIIVSTIILKELMYTAGDKFNSIKQFFDKSGFIQTIKTTNNDYILGRELESKFGFEISFYDCLHISICERINTPLITRDAELIRNAKGIIKVNKPEELIS